MTRQAKGLYEFGPYCLDATERVLLRDGRPVQLTPKVFETLLVLVERSGHIVDKDELMKEVWPDTFVEEANLARHVSTLRKILGDAPGGPQYIETIAKRGYRFTAEVTRLGDAGLIVATHTTSRIIAEQEIETDEDAATESLQARLLEEGAKQKRAWWSRRAIIVSGAVLIVAAVAVYLWMSRKPDQPTGEVRTIAVLPFKTLAGESGDEYLGLGLADALITKFGNTTQIIVRPTSAVRKYSDPRFEPAAAGRELGVEAVLDGTIQRTGDRIRLTVQLIRSSDGGQLWAETFDDKFTDIFAVQDSISEQVARALTLKLSAEEKRRLAKQYTKNTEAYQAYLKGRYFWNKRDAEGFTRAIEFFTQATDIDPEYALAYAGVADCYNLLPGYAGHSGKDVFPQAKAAAESALKIDDTLSEAHASMGWVKLHYDLDWPGAEAELKRAIELNQNYPTAHQWYGMHLYKQRRFDEAIANLKRAQELDPLSPSIAVGVGLAYYYAGRYEEAVREYLKILDLNPSFVPGRFQLGRAYSQMKKHEEAIAEFKKAVEISNRNPVTVVGLCRALAIAGKRAEARKLLDELSGQSRALSYNFAIINATLGDKDEAFRQLEQAFDDRDVNITYLNVDPDLEPLRSDTRFQELLSRVGLAR